MGTRETSLPKDKANKGDTKTSLSKDRINKTFVSPVKREAFTFNQDGNDRDLGLYVLPSGVMGTTYLDVVDC